MSLYVGAGGYSCKQWKGASYPGDLPGKRMLHYYGERFKTVEINMFQSPSVSIERLTTTFTDILSAVV
ncbi:MAG: hypothetical protein ACLQVJ_15320 [Syntrophobacteraceae bacterium]